MGRVSRLLEHESNKDIGSVSPMQQGSAGLKRTIVQSRTHFRNPDQNGLQIGVCKECVKDSRFGLG